MTSAPDAPQGRSIDDRYRIIARIADGGMATVYRATDERLDRTVAVKIMHRQLAQGPHHEQFVERFHREARSAAAIANPHIVQVYDTGEVEGLEYLVMEYVHGVNLRHEMNLQGTFSVRETLRIVLETLDGLSSAHRAGVIHRDIKPENILLNDRGHVQITDFGLAKAMSQDTLSSTGMLLGTAAYLPPEMIAENLATPQGDLYSVGIMAWEMLTGEVPFTSGNPVTMVFKHVHEDVPSIAAICPDIDPGITDLLASLTARSLSNRPVDATAAYDQLRSTMAHLDLDGLQYRRDPAEIPSQTQDPLSRPIASRDEGDAHDDATRQHPLARLSGIRNDSTHEDRTRNNASTAPGLPDIPAPPTVTSQQESQPHPVDSFDSFLTEHLGTQPTSTLPAPNATRIADNRNPGSHQATVMTAAMDALATDSVDAKSDDGPSAASISTPPPNRGRRLLVPMIVLLAALTMTAGAAGWWYLRGPGSYWTMPRPSDVSCSADTACRITKASWKAYESTLKIAGIPYRVTYDYSDTIASGDIIRADPADTGDHVSKRRGKEATIVVSRGIRQATIPTDIDDPSTADGKNPEAALQRAGFSNVRHDSNRDEYSQTLPEHSLQSIDPKPGTTLNHNAPITVVLSKGPMPVSMPDVIGRSKDDAQASFDDAKLDVTYTEEFSDSVKAGDIISTSVSKGTQLHWGDDVQAVVSKGPQTADVPNVVFSSPEDARKKLEALGFKVQVNGTPILNLIRQQSAQGKTRLRDEHGNATVIVLELV